MSNLHRNPLNLFGQAFWCLGRGFTFNSVKDSIPGLHLLTIHTNEYHDGAPMYVENVRWSKVDGWDSSELPPFGEWEFDDDPPTGWHGEEMPAGIGRAYCLKDSADADYREFLATFERLAALKITTEHEPEGVDEEGWTTAELVRFHCHNGRYQDEQVAMAPTSPEETGWDCYGTSPGDAEIEAALLILAALECRKRNGEATQAVRL